MQPFTDRVLEALARHTGLPRGELRLEVPRDAALGDLAFPCFPLAKARKQAPPKIAAELAQALAADLEGIAVAAAGPYLNFTVERALLARTVLGAIAEAGERFGGSDEGAGKTVVVDLSSPNIAKPMSVGHLRSTVIGAAVQRLHDALGYTTVGINHIGDWGSQFGKIVAAWQRWGDTVDLESEPIKALLALYVRYHDEEEGDPALQAAARAAFQELESGEDGEVRRIWRRMTELSLREFDEIYRRLGVTFDEVRGESFYESHLEATLQRVVDAGITEVSDGALIVDLSAFDRNLPPCLLRKSDGTTLYATRDLAALFHRWELYRFERALYVVGGEQRLHFRQLKHVLERMGYEWQERVVHVDFGLLRLPEGKMSTRKGRVVFLQDVLDRAVDEARAVIRAKNPDLVDPDAVAEQVGIGAVVFGDLRRERVRDIEFDWQEVLSFEGETGPYVQYTHARLASILRRAEAAGEGGAEPDWNALESAGPLLALLCRTPEVLRSAAERAEPSELATHLLRVCRETSGWIQDRANRVLGADPPSGAARLALVAGCKTVIANGLRILGLGAPTEM